MILRKLLQCNLLAVGIVMLVYSVYMPLRDASELYIYNALLGYAPGQMSFSDFFAEIWQQSYWWLTLTGGAMVVLAVLLLVIFRKSDSRLEIMPTVMISSGMMLETLAFLQAWSAAVEKVYDVGRFDYALNSGTGSILTATPNGALTFEVTIDAAIGSPWKYLSSGYEDQLWLVILGAVLIVIGIIPACRKKPESEISEEEPAEEMPEEIPEEIIIPREEAVIRLYCTVMDIRGDYALVKYDDTGIESEVAIALLPLGVDAGDKLKYENYEFERV